MKKIIALILTTLVLSSNQAFALDLDKIAGAVNAAAGGGSGQQKKGSPLASIQDNVVGKLEEKINKVTDRIEQKVENYEKKFDEYGKKLDEAEKAVDKVTKTINNFQLAQFEKYIQMRHYT